MSAARSRQRSAAPCALQKASVVARKDGIARSWLYGRTISAVRGSSCDRKQQGLSCRRSGLGTTSNARRRGRSVGRQGACAGRGCAGGRVGWGGLLRGAQGRAQWRRARFASHAVTKWVLARKRKRRHKSIASVFSSTIKPGHRQRARRAPLGDIQELARSGFIWTHFEPDFRQPHRLWPPIDG